MSDEEDYFLPLEDQRVFGAGIRRKRVPFVRSSEHELNTTTSTSTTAPQTPDAGTSIASKYLSIVLPKDARPQTTTPSQQEQEHKQTRSASAPPSSTCEVCNLPIPPASGPPPEEGEGRSNDQVQPQGRRHEASLAHQLCLAHSHPPSHLDRSRPGLRYLSAYGWDPDRRVGLGVPGREGIREPVKGRMKADT
ncbi:G-patch domain protein, partial [Aspergillus sp. HF37]